jgi:glycosyltransferase involved in cell wall biosynthesis
MRVLFVGGNSGGGGTESHFIALARAMAEAGHDVVAAVRPDDFIHRNLQDDQRIRLFSVRFRSRRDLRTIRELTRLARELKPDWIVSWFKAEYWSVAVAAKSAGVPVMLFSHLDQRIRPYMVARLMGLVQGVIVPSQYLRRRSIERGLPESRVVVLPNPIDVNSFCPDAELRAQTRAALGLSDTDVLIGYAGRFEPEKGVPTLARALNTAMARCGRVHALWVGHGKGESTLREITAESGFESRHHYMPWLDDVHPAYAAMDILALPSEGSEAFGRVLIEAQACGIPVLGAANGGIPEALVNGHTGRVLPPGNVAVWAAAITELVADYRRLRLAVNARSFATRFDSRHIVDGFVRILESFDPVRVPAMPVPITLAAEVGAD